MKRSKILLLSLTGIAVAAVSGGYYFWRQFTQLPDWYAEEQSSPRTYTQIQESGAAIERKIAAQIQTNPQPASTNITPNFPEPQPSKPVQVALSSQELNDLLVTKITEKSGGKGLPNSVKGFQTSVKNDQLKTGAVVDIKELQNSGIGSQHQALLTQITEKIPMSDRKVYIGIEGKPEIQNGKLHFDQNAKIQVGNMSFTITEVANRLGVSPQKVQDQLNLELKLRSLTVKDINFQDGNAVLSGAAK
ncbi:hypothetical protein [Leptolyngbya sp. FACHB-17]|uniref:hypothetical protein n=1 Tax=unclassified Leptolyngbya TaxID=2650499 RepID=UPI00168188B2|nr:hypothetical protein [Leptolyngbya sp. FACHB-17]MBD2079390.1 hypothetical protein [Leptolyngbya sp. FACHB-17]